MMSAQNPPGPSPGKILVVDDDRLVLATVVHGLTAAGYVVIDADNGDDAILLAREHRPDLAMLDIRMEGKSGFDVAAYLREALQTPFMFLSAFADAETAAKVRELGALAYLVKPLDIRQIVPAVEAAFAQARRMRGQAGQAATSTDVGAPAQAQSSATAQAASPPSEAQGVSAGAARSPLAAGQPAEALGEAVAMATGVLMHRYSLRRAEALSTLRQQAAAEHRPLDVQAELVLRAVEVLAPPVR